REESAAVQWVTPKLVVEVRFTEWTDDRRLRHPAFEGVREDRSAASVRLEKTTAKQKEGAMSAESKEPAQASQQPAPPSPSPSRTTARAQHGHAVLGIVISHPGRVVFPSAGVTKGELAEYYAMIAQHL